MISAVVLATVPIACGEDSAEFSGVPPAKLGGKGSARELRERPMNQPARTLTNAGRRSFGTGAILFRDGAETVTEGHEDVIGLGPTFVETACVACHVDGLNAGGSVPASTEKPDGLPAPGMILRISDGVDEHGKPAPDARWGLEIQPKAIKGFEPEGKVSATWATTTATLADGTKVSLYKPTVEFKPATGDGQPTSASARIATPLIGLSLLESIPQSDLETAADPDDADGDGISGEVQMVWSPDETAFVVGRFGWKAAQPTVRDQTAGAAAFDMGVTSERQPDGCDQSPCPTNPPAADRRTVDLSRAQFDELAIFTEAIAVPESEPLRAPTEAVRSGAALFGEIGCSDCHTPVQTTGPSAVPGHIEGETFYPYTDMLLHDMGVQLADTRVEYQASESEWRTPPLWSMWLRNDVGFGRMLHDGRAGTVEQAILWHGGEGKRSRDGFANLPKEDRDAVVAFVNSL